MVKENPAAQTCLVEPNVLPAAAAAVRGQLPWSGSDPLTPVSLQVTLVGRTYVSSRLLDSIINIFVRVSDGKSEA